MNDLVRIAMAELMRFLATQLPDMSDDWWEKHVVDRLSFQQQRTVQKRDYKRLEQLDLAALLRILDQNWFELPGHLRLPRNPDQTLSNFRLTALYSEIGQIKKSSDQIAELLKKNPHASIRQVRISKQYQDERKLKKYLNLLRSAGLSE